MKRSQYQPQITKHQYRQSVTRAFAQVHGRPPTPQELDHLIPLMGAQPQIHRRKAK